jgi:hypothetical protein
MKKQLIYLIVALLITISLYFVSYYYFNNNYKSGFTNNDSNEKTIILLGDSILNNSNYVEYEDSVSALIKKTCFSDSKNISRGDSKGDSKSSNIILAAQDNAKVEDVYQQIDKLVGDIFDSKNTYIFLSVGGNNMLDTKFVSLDALKQSYLKLVTHIKTKFPKSNIYLLGLYYPFDTRFKRYNSSISEWNQFIKSLEYKYIMLDGLLTNKSDIIFSIEPSATGSKKIANEICKAIYY